MGEVLVAPFKRWAVRASTPGGKAALSKKRKADEAVSAKEDIQGEAKAQKTSESAASLKTG